MSQQQSFLENFMWGFKSALIDQIKTKPVFHGKSDHTDIRNAVFAQMVMVEYGAAALVSYVAIARSRSASISLTTNSLNKPFSSSYASSSFAVGTLRREYTMLKTRKIS